MGIDTDYYEYGNDCLYCFRADKTPKTMYISISGGAVCPNAPEGTPGPLSGVFKLPQMPGFPCIWQISKPTWSVNLRIWANDVIVSAQQNEWPVQAYSSWGKPCVWSLTGPPYSPTCISYYGGGAQIAWVPPGESPSLYNIAQLLNIELTPETKAEFWPLDEETVVFMFANQKKPTRIKIKLDMPEFDQYSMFDKE